MNYEIISERQEKVPQTRAIVKSVANDTPLTKTPTKVILQQILKKGSSCCLILLGVSYAGAQYPMRRRKPSSRANPSYMYLNHVQVVSTRGSSALPKNQQISGDPGQLLGCA